MQLPSWNDFVKKISELELETDSKEKDVIKIVRANSKLGMIFISPVSNAIDIGSGKEGDQVL